MNILPHNPPLLNIPPHNHPLLQFKRPMIITRPGERLAGSARTSIEMGCDAIWIEGKGRVGKTFGFRQLVQTDAWRPFPMHMVEFTYPLPGKSSETYFMASLLGQLGQTVSTTATSHMLLMRLVRLLNEQRNKCGAQMIGLGFNEANRFTSDDYEHAMSIGNELEKTTRAFFFFINQSDAGRLGTRDTDSRPPPHIYGRFFTNSHLYTGLLWDIPAADGGLQTLSDVALAFEEYDTHMVWPEGSGISATQYFAPQAWAEGWRLGAQIDLIRSVIDEMRAEAGLGAVATWPMQSFERFVYFTLVRTAAEDATFRRLTADKIRFALRCAHYFATEPGYMGVAA